MTSEEIKQEKPMRVVLEQYGLRPNRAGFICCPFHKERTPSFKVYEDSFHCFGCGASGDIFRFVQMMDKVPFKDAYLALGGEYQDQRQGCFSAKLRRYKLEKARMMREKEAARRRLEVERNTLLLGLYGDILREAEPMSEEWCWAYFKWDRQVRVQCDLHGLEY